MHSVWKLFLGIKTIEAVELELALAKIHQRRVLALRARGATRASPQPGHAFFCRSMARYAMWANNQVALVSCVPAQSHNVLDPEQHRSSSSDLELTFMEVVAVFID